MKKTKMLIPLAAALLALSSCGNSTSESSSVATTEAGTSQAGSSSQQGGSEQGGSSQQEITSESEGLVVEPLFGEVKDSPKNVLTNDKLLGYINQAIALYNDFTEKMASLHGEEAYLVPEITAEQLSEFLSDPQGGALIAGMMNNNRLTDEEIAAGYAAAGIFFNEIYSIGQNLPTDGDIPESMVYNAIFTDEVLLEAVASLLKDVELDHLFKTILDTEGAVDLVLSIFAPNSSRGYHGAELLNPLESAAFAALPDDPVLAAVQESKNAQPIQREQKTPADYISIDLVFAMIRLAKDAYLALDEVGFEKFIADYAAIVEEIGKTQGGYDAGGMPIEPQAPDYAVFINAAKDVAAVLKLLNYPASDFDRLIDLFFEEGLASMDEAAPSGPYFSISDKTVIENIKGEVTKLRNVISGNMIKAAIDLFAALTETVAPTDIDDVSKGIFDGSFAKVEEAYGELSAEEKASVNAFLGYAGLSAEQLFRDFKAADGPTTEEKAQAQMAVLQNFFQTIVDRMEFGSGYGMSYSLNNKIFVGDTINTDVIRLSYAEYNEEGPTVYHDMTEFTLVSGDTSKAGYIDVTFKAKFEGVSDEHEFVAYNVLVYPEVLKHAGYIENAYFGAGQEDFDNYYFFRDDEYNAKDTLIINMMSDHVVAFNLDMDWIGSGSTKAYRKQGIEDAEVIPWNQMPVTLEVAPNWRYSDSKEIKEIVIDFASFIGGAAVDGFRSIDVEGYHAVYFVGDTSVFGW